MKREDSIVMKSVELFSGCGGLAMGLAQSGFHHLAMVEWNAEACATLQHNKRRKVRHVKAWPFQQADVRSIDWNAIAECVDLVAGGPPCQPFSIGGKGGGNADERDMWPEAVRAVRELQPKAFLFENVRGLLRPAFTNYLNWIQACLARPEARRRQNESHDEHVARLSRMRGVPTYRVEVFAVNAADYGAPQKRHRVIIAGGRSDLDIHFDFPEPTHTYERLLWDQWVSGEYWERHNMSAPKSGPTDKRAIRIVERLKSSLLAPKGRAWVTVRDAIHGLGEPGNSSTVLNHTFQAGARIYPGHTGSPLDEPAKALKAGDHGVPGGENMMVKDDGSVRYFTIREAARLQGLPDEFEFPRSWTESMRQLGNAVPVQLANAMGKTLSTALRASSCSISKAA
ncbi:DNA cytosine methyltransferase [Parvibaculum sp.]|uniref:DNA cytosine methyltransferase n=1 Tax=Parvibaculum sp. TaxID=2024848 RepID=UPI00273219FB|nr:DNA cytosine methyltransferase [Parvibaculum sp.]MDP1626741.1 DNA cytosine methyltransferase [Parvibaculum sp.]MDP3329796.1 DNA cytosine methyltransferase [Parvibaculum sp.]